MAELQKTKSSWLWARRILITLAVLATLIAVFYTEEDWRGKRAWENYKNQLEAQGVVLDWDKFLPPSVPDDQNFYTASSNILLTFKQHSEDDPDYKAALTNSWLRLQTASSNSYPTLGSPVVAKIIVTSEPPADAGGNTNILIVSLNDTNQADQARDLINSVIGPGISGAMGPQFYKGGLKNLRPVQIYVLAEIMPSRSELQTLIPPKTRLRPSDSDLQTLIPSDARPMAAAAVLQKGFDVDLGGVYQNVNAGDYLRWSDQFVPAFGDLREALKRPYAILPGDYSSPYQSPVPNFVMMRLLAQTLAQRAQCYLLLGEPDKALSELALVHDVCRILEKPPTGQPETLVEAMINVAIHGLYVAVIEEGMQRHVWQESQLKALQQQLATIDLPGAIKRAFASEQAATTCTLETLPARKLGDLFLIDHGRQTNSLWKTMAGWRWMAVPRGWIYQNMVTGSRLKYQQTSGFDSPDNIIRPGNFRDISHELGTIPWRYKFIAAEFVPNLTKAWQNTAYQQTMLNEAQIACALERYHLAHGKYPGTLDALTPQYLEAIPQDIIDGQPLHYRRTEDGKFLLYSVGWNETDDGGQALHSPGYPYSSDHSKGDWVWPN